ncbi:MAG: PorV/PorQ family protein [Krumholzibacteria bacterium]|nr:PorV/PorQ family protein [Candidatus Krumholzibacteria bacterium]
MKRISIAATLAVALSGVLAAQALASGAGAISLTFPIGARYNALGEAGTALSQDVTAIWWNPGGLAFLPQRAEPHDVQIMQSSLAAGLADDIALYWAGYATPMGRHGALGFALTYLDMGEQQGTDENGDPTGTFDSYEFAFSATYGVQVSRTLGVGLGVKYFRDKLAPDASIQDPRGGGSGDSFGVDLGMLWKVPKIRSNIGLAVSNLGPDITHVDQDQSDPMPRKATLGIAFSMYSSEAMGLLMVGDYLVPLYKWKGDDYGFGLETDQAVYGGGVEWNYLRSLFVRFGYKNDDTGDIKDSTWGFGVDLDRWVGQPILFDFASVPQAEGLDRVNRLSLGYRW